MRFVELNSYTILSGRLLIGDTAISFVFGRSWDHISAFGSALNAAGPSFSTPDTDRSAQEGTDTARPTLANNKIIN